MNDLERIKEVINSTNLKLDELATKTGIGSDRWRNLRSGKVKPRIEDIRALAEICPEYAHWLAYGKEIPEAGQISPSTAETLKSNRA